MKKNLIIGLIILALFLVACSSEEVTQDNIENTEENTEIEDTEVGTETEVETGMIVEGSGAEDMIVENLEESSGITLSELNEHSSEDDCWVAYDGKVYDITTFLSEHKSPLGKYCGTSEDFEKAYLEQHKGTKDNKLSEYEIGIFE